LQLDLMREGEEKERPYKWRFYVSEEEYYQFRSLREAEMAFPDVDSSEFIPIVVKKPKGARKWKPSKKD